MENNRNKKHVCVMCCRGPWLHFHEIGEYGSQTIKIEVRGKDRKLLRIKLIIISGLTNLKVAFQ